MRRHPYHLLVVTLAAQLNFLALDFPGRWTDLVNLLFALLLAVLLYRITDSRRDFWMLLVLAGSASALNLVLTWHGSPLFVNLFKVALWCAAPAFLAWRVFLAIYDADPVRHHELSGAVSIYLLLAYVFANLFEAMYVIDSTSLRFGENFAGRSVGFGEILYFSFITLATLGYGDVAPAHPVTRAIAVTEAVTGLLFMSILVARFVSLLTTQRARRGP